MSTIIRPEVSEKNPYWINKHRYYELKHFCLQYPIWKEEKRMLTGIKSRSLNSFIFSNEISDPTEKCVEARTYYEDRMQMVRDAADKVDCVVRDYILRAVTLGLSYELMSAGEILPFSKDTYYKAYRKYFWELSRARK